MMLTIHKRDVPSQLSHCYLSVRFVGKLSQRLAIETSWLANDTSLGKCRAELKGMTVELFSTGARHLCHWPC
jgi:hypothetical protein